MGQIRQNAEAKTEIGPPLSDRALYSDKAHSSNQSERALYRNFFIIVVKVIVAVVVVLVVAVIVVRLVVVVVVVW